MTSQPLVTGNASETTLNRWKEYEYVVGHSAVKGYQTGSLIAPPSYIAYAFYKSRPTLNGFLRTTWLAGGVGSLLGVVAAVARLHSATEESIADRKQRLQYNEGQVRVDGLAGIGAWVMAVVTPALFWKYARLPHLVLGGAGLGTASGVLAHLAMKYREGESMKPEGMADVITGK